MNESIRVALVHLTLPGCVQSVHVYLL